VISPKIWGKMCFGLFSNRTRVNRPSTYTPVQISLQFKLAPAVRFTKFSSAIDAFASPGSLSSAIP
jgi:hypothetical protein